MGQGTIDTRRPAWHTGQLRYDFQIACVRRHPGTVLNVGCNEDPTGLRHRFGKRVINCDREGWDEHENRPNHVDQIWDALKPWPFEADSAELVVLGDILEHFPVEQMIQLLKEAHRVAPKVCITVPEDVRIDQDYQHSVWAADNYNFHTTIVTQEIVDHILREAGFTPVWMVRGPWGFDDVQGFCVLAERQSSPAMESCSGWATAAAKGVTEAVGRESQTTTSLATKAVPAVEEPEESVPEPAQDSELVPA